MPLLYRARWSFLGDTRPLLQTGRSMARWAEAAAGVLAPELEWAARVQEHADLDLVDRWETSHVVRFTAAAVGGGVSRLVAGGRKHRIGGSSRVELRALAPMRYLDADSHCDVTHWDVRLGGIDEAAVRAIRLLLEAELESRAAVANEHVMEYERGPRIAALTDDEEDARLWAGDLEDAGLAAVAGRLEDGWEVRVESSGLASLDDLEQARITLGEVLAESGVEDWAEQADELLAQLSSSGPFGCATLPDPR